jgi:hypothetical protein
LSQRDRRLLGGDRANLFNIIHFNSGLVKFQTKA